MGVNLMAELLKPPNWSHLTPEQKRQACADASDAMMAEWRTGKGWQPTPDQDGRLWSSYDVEIRRNADGVVRVCHQDTPWHHSSFFWWTDGNGACDCNRALYFLRGGGEDAAADVDETDCGDDAYRVIRAIFPDGSTLQIDN